MIEAMVSMFSGIEVFISWRCTTADSTMTPKPWFRGCGRVRSLTSKLGHINGVIKYSSPSSFNKILLDLPYSTLIIITRLSYGFIIISEFVFFLLFPLNVPHNIYREGEGEGERGHDNKYILVTSSSLP